jgi:3alpha(or 20beta)-hydroxysteroid dehydrogenase
MSDAVRVGVLAGKVAIVTGAARGQGAAEVDLFLSEGCSVVATDKDAKALRSGQPGSRLLTLRHDVGNESDWSAVVKATISAFGRVDILVNNAAIFVPQTFQNTDRAQFDLHYSINQVGVFLGMKAVWEIMAASGIGSIVNVSSVAGIRGSSGAFAYATSKWAIRGMSKSAARDLAATGIRVNAVIPGLIETAMMEKNPAERNATIISNIPMARPGKATDVASAVMFLASDASSYLTGSEITIDGGLSG